MPRRVDIDDQVFERVEAACPTYLSTTGFINLLLDRNVDEPVTLDKRAGASVSKAVTTSKKKTSITTLSLERIPDSLSPYAGLIQEFWKSKKGAKNETALGLLIENLERIRDKHGPYVLEEQLKLGINGRWQSITLKNFENFSGKPGTKEPEHRHPASQVFTAKDFDNGPTTNPALQGLF